MYRVVLTNMNNGDSVVFDYKNKKRAKKAFIDSCESISYKYFEAPKLQLMVAGGVDHDFRIELIEE